MSFDRNTGLTCVWLSSASYCDPGTYYSLSGRFQGYAAGFVLTQRIGSYRSNAEGFVGYLPSQSAIYVVFQGTQDIMQWFTNVNAKKITYPACQAEYAHMGKNPCQVHEGFYRAQMSVNNVVISAVRDLLATFPTYQVIVTGHSLGGALATLQAVSIIQTLNIQARLFTFGAPREFNNQAASSVSSYIADINRVTHFADPVPHLPPMNDHVLVYRHIHGEWYQQHTVDGTNIFKSCGNAPYKPYSQQYYEDPTCANQWEYVHNWEHHSYYLENPISSCGLAFTKPARFAAAVVKPNNDVYNLTLNMAVPDVWIASHADDSAASHSLRCVSPWIQILCIFVTMMMSTRFLR